MDETIIAPAEAPFSEDYEVGRPTLEDIPRLLELWKEQYDYHNAMDPEYYVPFSDELRSRLESDLPEAIEGEEPHIFVAREGESILGFITFSREHDDYYDAQITDFGVLKEVLVAETARSKGVGQRLVKSAEDYFTGIGVSNIMIQCSTFNPRTLDIYQKAGYVSRQTLLYKKF
jgi:GNAT superfamily N-acetyltransferase